LDRSKDAVFINLTERSRNVGDCFDLSTGVLGDEGEIRGGSVLAVSGLTIGK